MHALQTTNTPSAGRGWLKTLAVIAISLIIGLLLAEGLVRLANGLGLVNLQASLNDLPAVQQPEDGVSLTTTDARPLYLADTRLHHRMAANWTGAFPQEALEPLGRSDVPITTNALGLRGPEVLQPKPSNEVRLLALGDSVTFGWGLRGEDAYPAQLASLLATLRPAQHFEVINAGVSGYGTWQELLWLQDDGSALQPDIVIVQLHLNDAADNLWGTLGWQSNTQSWLTRTSLLVRLVQRVTSQPPRSDLPCATDWQVNNDEVCWQRTTELLAELEQSAQAAGAQVVLFPAPMRWQVESGVRDPRAWVDAARYQDVLQQQATQHGWLFVDPLPAFRQAAASGQALFVDVGHPNEAGQRLIAQQLYSALNTAGALDQTQ